MTPDEVVKAYGALVVGFFTMFLVLELLKPWVKAPVPPKAPMSDD
jgi:hypothetical protein